MGGTDKLTFPGASAPDSATGLPAPDLEPSALKLMNFSEKDQSRLDVAEGIRDFHSGDWSAAETLFSRQPGDPVARGLWNEIRYRRNTAQRAPLPDLLRALALDSSVVQEYSSQEKELLLGAIAEVSKHYQSGAEISLKESTLLAQKEWQEPTNKIWRRFMGDISGPWNKIEQAFEEIDPELLAKNCLWLARELRSSRLGGSAWLMANLALQHPSARTEALNLIADLEGKRMSTEFIISDIFDQGGSSIALNLLALAPTIGFTRRLYRARPIYALLAGGPIHWASTKSLMLLTRYSGRIAPEGIGDFLGEMGSSYLQASAGILLSHRFFWRVNKPIPKNPAALAERAAALGKLPAVQRFFWKLPGRIWWTTKTSLKVSTFTATGLGTQYLSHLSGIKPMTERGLPALGRHFFPQTWETRREVGQGYQVRRDLHERGAIPKRLGPSDPTALRPEPAAGIDQWLSQAAPGADAYLYQLLFFELYSASQQGNFGLNVQRWIRKKLEQNDYAGANLTWEQKGIPIRFDALGQLCLTDSDKYPCLELPKPKSK